MTNVENKTVYLKIAIIKVVFLKDSLTNISVEKLCMFHYFILILHMLMRQNVSPFLYFSGIYILLYSLCKISFVTLDHFSPYGLNTHSLG